jgi:hypothetical protein
MFGVSKFGVFTIFIDRYTISVIESKNRAQWEPQRIEDRTVGQVEI